MSIILYDDDFKTIGVEIPPYASITQDISVNQKWSVTLPATNENVVRQILEYIKLRNQTLTFNSQQNIRFHDNGVWQKDGATVSLDIEEVTT